MTKLLFHKTSVRVSAELLDMKGCVVEVGVVGGCFGEQNNLKVSTRSLKLRGLKEIGSRSH